MVRCIQLPQQEQDQLFQAQKRPQRTLRRFLLRKIPKKKTSVKQFSAILKEDHLLCPICLDIMVIPAITACGHAFCLSCFEDCCLQSLKEKPKKYNCPVCRAPLSFYECMLSSSLQTATECFIASRKGKKYRQSFIDRMKIQRQKEEKRIQSINVGKNVSFFDERRSRWRKGRVVRSNIDSNLNTVLSIQATDKKRRPDKPLQWFLFFSDSRRLAPEGP